MSSLNEIVAFFTEMVFKVVRTDVRHDSVDFTVWGDDPSVVAIASIDVEIGALRYKDSVVTVLKVQVT